MKSSKRLVLTSLLFVFISLIFHLLLPYQTLDIQFHDTYIVLTKSSIFVPFIFFFFLFSRILLYLEKKRIKEPKSSHGHYWGSIFLSILIMIILLSKAWWISKEMAAMGSPAFYYRSVIENRFILCIVISMLLFLLLQAVYFISILISIIRK